MQKKAIDEILRSPLRKKFKRLSNSPEDDKEQSVKKRVHRKIITQVSNQTPRFVKCVSHDVENGNIKEYAWDKEKIFVHECLYDDVLMLQNVFEGKIISPLVYPLVFDSKSPQKEISMRSVQFYKEVQDDNSIYQNLSPDDKGYFLIGARDLFIAACRGMLSPDEKELLVNIVNLIDPKDINIVYKTINNIDIAPYPTATHKMVKFLEEERKSEEDNNILDECFVRNELGLLIGFVDPRDLSFHNFENIINLDSLFKTGEDFPITNFQKHGDSEVYTFDLEDSRNLLLSLDKCGLYTQPLNKLSRGGERFIFASKVFGDNLTNSLRKHVSDKTVVNPDFQFVNYVFRYNKFKSGDRKFTSHFDTSYHDPAREHYSKYTLLLYLTSGTADPILSIDNGKVKINNIESTGLIRGVIFDQKYEHEGKSFIDSEKIFLRSELVYSYPEQGYSFNADISKKFNIACYMTKQSVFNPELEQYASDCFNQAAQARIDLVKAKMIEDVLIYKNYLGVPFITNGYDYWFLKKTSLKAAGIVTILDYFGGKYTGIEMKDHGPGLIYKIENLENVKDIFKCLQNYVCPHKNESMKEQENISIEDDGSDSESLIDSLQSYLEEELDIDQIDIKKLRSAYQNGGYYDQEEEEEEEDENENEEEDEDEEEDDENDKEDEKDDDDDDDDESYSAHEDDEANEDDPYRCHFCRGEHPMKSDVEDYLKRKKDWINELYSNKSEYAIFIFDKEIKIEKSIIKVNQDTIVFEEEIPPVNFANCQFDLDDYQNDHIFGVEKIQLRAFANIPPIHYETHPEGHHLKIELFNNGFVREECLEFEKTVLKEKFFKTEDIPE